MQGGGQQGGPIPEPGGLVGGGPAPAAKQLMEITTKRIVKNKYLWLFIIFTLLKDSNNFLIFKIIPKFDLL